ncbi:MAG TPA: hypothetical protein VGX49_15100 [Jatrophihabitans sp.]|jgi:hypothetical protein|nr:hypothetical protein [Jatrophihabitans sp.]
MSSPRVFGLPHLSEDAVAAFADGVLSAAAASRARRHCAECVECADAVRGQRETAMMLRAAQAPALPSGLLDRLGRVPMSTPLPPPRGGLPTVLSADGTAMFVAHDVHKASQAAPAAEHAEGPGRPVHRRGALPVTVLASAAAVVAAGTFGGHVSTLAAAGNRPAPAGAANVAGSLLGSQNVAARSPISLTGAGSLLSTSPPAGPARNSGDQPTGPAVRPSVQRTTSVTVTPVRRNQHPSAASIFQRPSAGFAPMMAGAPAAAP